MPEDQEIATQYWCEPHKVVRMFGTMLIGDAQPPHEERMPATGAGLLILLLGLMLLVSRVRPSPRDEAG